MEQQISQVINGQVLPTISQQHSEKNSNELRNLSQRQKSDLEAFKNHFDSTEKLTRVFAPAMWGKMIERKENCITSPCITLSMIDTVYHVDGLAKQIVRNQIAGIYSLCTARDQYNTQGVDMASDLFLAKYGKQCTLYAMMLYFGNYLVEYKSSYAQFDMQDILQQFGKKFLPWWNSQQKSPSEFIEQKQTESLVGTQAMHRMFADRLINGATLDDIRNSNLFKLGYCKEEDLAQIQRIAEECF